ncbi:SMP-30/gluconolactonase/LRE family protein [Paenibacillus sp. CC-CFT747]|nr:SMP-30/gluconolactonase/LRE family protein [Paenibacillus sp. CC-CFT747]
MISSTAFTSPSGFTRGIEGPACDREGNVYAVNYARASTIGKATPTGEVSVFLDLPEGSVASGIRFNRQGDMFLADYAKHNIFRVDKGTQELSVFAHEPRMNQPNDLAITRGGVLFASDPNWKDSTGNLWRIDPDGSITLLEVGMGTTNGIEVSPDEKTLYVNETVQRKIWAYDLSANGEISNKRLLAEFDDHLLDGMRCDMAGNLYVTRYGKGVIAKLSPQGELLLEVQLEGTDCTNLTFGGPEGRHGYVTVADTGNLQVFLADQPGRCWGMWQD